MKDFYGAINFTGETRAGPFWWQIIRGQKAQTIREPRKDGRDHVKMGELTKLYWKMRIRAEKKPIHLIAYAKVLAYERISLLEVWFDEENARADGFEDLDEFRLWFLPGWFEFSDIEQEAVRAASEVGRDIAMTLGRAFGKNKLAEAISKLQEPMMRIEFEVVAAARPTCPICGKRDASLTPVEADAAACQLCNQVSAIENFQWDPPVLFQRIA